MRDSNGLVDFNADRTFFKSLCLPGGPKHSLELLLGWPKVSPGDTSYFYSTSCHTSPMLGEKGLQNRQTKQSHDLLLATEQTYTSSFPVCLSFREATRLPLAPAPLPHLDPCRSTAGCIPTRAPGRGLHDDKIPE